jgi:hypothetical protein
MCFVCSKVAGSLPPENLPELKGDAVISQVPHNRNAILALTMRDCGNILHASCQQVSYAKKLKAIEKGDIAWKVPTE